MGWKAALKTVRASQPFNAMSTVIVRGALATTGMRSEWIIRHLHRVGSVSDRLPNGRVLRLWSRGDDWVSNQVYWRGWEGYEPETVRVFFERAVRSRVTLDIGAYVGYFSLLAAHANVVGRVFAFEPHPGIFERLGGHVRLNGLTNVECVNAAVGEVAGRARFYAIASGLPTSSSLSEEFMKGCDDLRPFDVDVVSIDDFVRERGITGVDLVKIDTESTEPKVLQGMKTTLQRDHPAIVCEVLPGQGTGAALESLLGPLGYRYYLLSPDGALPRERIEGHAVWLNHLFVQETLDGPRA